MAELTNEQLAAIHEYEDTVPEPPGEPTTVLEGDNDFTAAPGNNDDIVIGGDGDNTISTGNGADWVDGGAGDDIINGGNDDDVLYGNTGNDVLNGGNHDDELWGGAGDDELNGGNHDDVLYGGSGNDVLNGGDHEDVLVGGAGDDDLWGGNGNDHFVFRFAVEAGEGEYTTVYFRPNDDGDGGDTPDGHANPQAWLNYLQQLSAWRAEMQELYGDDLEDDKVDIELVNKNIDKFILKYGDDLAAFDAEDWAEIDLLAKTLSFDNSWTYGDGGAATIQGEGHDTIHDWGNHSEGGQNTLYFYGLSDSNGDLNYWGDWLTSSVEDGNTVISWNGGSITLLGVATTIEDLVGDGFVSFDLPAAHYDIEPVVA